jgi:hypothetical protein
MAVNFPQVNTYQIKSDPIDFSALQTIVPNFWKGQAVGRESDLREEIQTAIKPDGTFDIQKGMAILAKYEPEAAMKMSLLDQQNQALNSMRGFGALPDAEKTRILYGGGMGGGGDAPNTAPMAQVQQGSGTESINPNGPYVPQQAPGPIAGTSLTQPSNVPAPGYTNLPEDVQKAIAPAGSVEYAKKSAENRVEREGKRPVDEALVANIDDKLGRLEQSAGELLAPGATLEERGPSEGLKRITGNYQLGGFDTRIPNAWLKDVTQPARDASAKLDNVVIQTGLGVLEQMRSATSTGASGMGQLAIEESRMLQNSIASYSQAQNPKDAATALRKVIYWTRKVRGIAKAKFKNTYGTDFVAPPPAEEPAALESQGSSDGVVDFNDYFAR